MAIIFNAKETFEQGVWCDYEAGVSFKLRALTPKKYRLLQERCTEKKYKRGQLIDKTDEIKLGKLVNSWIIEDWKGIETPEGTKVQCTDQNKQILLDNYAEISGFVSDMSLKIAEKIGQKKEQLKKK